MSRERLFIGRGFRWGERHTQRLHDCRRSKFHRFVEPGRLARWAHACAADGGKGGPARLGRLLAPDLPGNPFRAPPPVGAGPDHAGRDRRCQIRAAQDGAP